MLDFPLKSKKDDIVDNVLINISIPEKCVERNIEWNLHDTVDSLKCYVIKLLPDLDDPLNYGLFLPPCNGKNGKFLQEERILNHYLFEVPYKLELRKKIRIYYSNVLKLKKVNSKANQKLFILNIKQGEIMKINKLLNSGIDPNFHVTGFPESPLTLACRLPDPHKIIMALVSNGAYLDFRTIDSMTALHKVAKEGLYEPMKTLLQLGQSPNCKDNRGFTPLYYCIENDAPPDCVNLLLYEHSIMGIRDEQGFQEIHKACLYGRTIHLDHLLSYGADIDAKTNKGNSALHICAVHNQGSCARLLLYRGITRYSLDYENKSAYQTALLSNNLEIADLIQNFKDEDVVPVTSLPKFNEKRRSIFLPIKRFSSLNTLDNPNDESESHFTKNEKNISENKIPAKVNNSHQADCQSLKNFKQFTDNTNSTPLNTWSSPVNNMKLNAKTRIPIASIMNSKLENVPRTIVLQRGLCGFGFVIRGIKNECEIYSKSNNPATQYFECVAESSPAFQAGLLTGDYLLEVNHIDVHEMPHESVVKIIQMAGDCLTLKVITINQLTASTGIYGGSFEPKSNSECQSIISENSNSICISISDSNEDSNALRKDVHSDKKTLNFQDHTNSGGKKIKIPAPLPPTRNDNTSLSIFQNHKEHNSSETDNSIMKLNIQTTLPIIAKINDLSEPIALDKSKQYIPPPDYIPDIDIEIKSLTDNLKTYKLPLSSKSIYKEIVKSDVSVSHPLLQSLILSTPPLPPPAPPPPAPPPPPPPPTLSSTILQTQHNSKEIVPVNRIPYTLDKELSNISLKHVSQNVESTTINDTNPLLNDHSEALKFAILNHRRKIEYSESQSDHIEERLKENKVGNKSLIFDSNRISLLNDYEINKQIKPANSSLKCIDNNNTFSVNISKNPAIYPKPNTQIFDTFNVKPSINVLSKPISSTYNKDPDASNSRDINLRLKAENLRSNILKKEQENKKGTLYFSNEK